MSFTKLMLASDIKMTLIGLMLASDIKMTLIGFRKGARRCVRTKVGYKLI